MKEITYHGEVCVECSYGDYENCPYKDRLIVVDGRWVIDVL